MLSELYVSGRPIDMGDAEDARRWMRLGRPFALGFLEDREASHDT